MHQENVYKHGLPTPVQPRLDSLLMFCVQDYLLTPSCHDVQFGICIITVFIFLAHILQERSGDIAQYEDIPSLSYYNILSASEFISNFVSAWCKVA